MEFCSLSLSVQRFLSGFSSVLQQSKEMVTRPSEDWKAGMNGNNIYDFEPGDVRAKTGRKDWGWRLIPLFSTKMYLKSRWLRFTKLFISPSGAIWQGCTAKRFVLEPGRATYLPSHSAHWQAQPSVIFDRMFITVASEHLVANSACWGPLKP